MKWRDRIALGLALLLVAGAVVYVLMPTYRAPVVARTLALGDEAAVVARLKVASGYRLTIYAAGLGRPRLMQIDDAGAIIVSTYRDGAVVRLEPDRDGDGHADAVSVLARDLDRPHGLLLEGGTLYVAEQGRVARYAYGDGKLAARRIVLDGLPRGGHASRTLARGPDGRLYLSIGSSCNACIEKHPWRAAIIAWREGDRPQVFAAGLRNTVGFDWRPGSGALYGVNAGRDLLGDDHPREELNLIREDAHYGWPYVHGRDNRPDPQYGASRPKDLVVTAPVFTFTAHSTPLSIRFLRHQPGVRPGSQALVARHGSWNRSTKSGYDVVRLTFADDGAISAEPFITGFAIGDDVIGRPVDIVEANDGAIYISDDFAGVIYKVVRQ